MVREVYILMETSLRISRGLIQGILDYIHANRHWRIHYTSGGMTDQTMPRNWCGDGVIARVSSSELAKNLFTFKGPMVLFDLQEHYLSPSCRFNNWPKVMNDYAACGRLAADYFMDRGYRSFAFVGPTISSAPGLIYDGTKLAEPNWSRMRMEGFASRLAEVGLDCAVYPLPKTLRVSMDFRNERERLIRWIAARPKPLAVFTAHDARGVQLIEACRSFGINVPAEVAVLGVNNDELLCETCLPALSSVALDSVNAGFTAAQMLDKLMSGTKIPVATTLYSPLCVVTRGSTSRYVVSDPLVAAALQLIDESHGFAIHPSSIADELGISRRWLEMRFKETIGRGIAQTIRETMLDHIHHLVLETNIPFNRIASDAGISTAAHLSAIFRRRFGKAMTEVRRFGV